VAETSKRNARRVITRLKKGLELEGCKAVISIGGKRTYRPWWYWRGRGEETGWGNCALQKSYARAVAPKGIVQRPGETKKRTSGLWSPFRGVLGTEYGGWTIEFPLNTKHGP